MKIGVPRALIVALAALFSGYHLLLAGYSLQFPYASDPGAVVAGMIIYAVVTLTVLLPGRETRMPVWMAAFSLGVTIALPPLVTAVLDPMREGGNGYATWYVAAVGTLMTITAVRLRPGFAWAGVIFLGVQTLFWAGPQALATIGVIGSASWVGVAHILTNTLAKAARDSERFALAEREATEWQAAQEAHLNERQYRLGQTSITALPMLRTIRSSGGELTASQRAECLHLEAAIRDEIRGRRLLDDAVREQVMLARRRGTVVTLLDEGGIDELSEEDRERVLGRLALALRDTTADRVIARTVPEGSDVAVTVVGLRTVDDESVTLLGGEPDDEVELWLEIPRQAPAAD
ncbi:hypothetical protein [Homoserinibacter sp. GY 40078]|uniref:hypothetical protein n=1 Tax=Homoserinibacter sp. GY 40078 TaxID=2603275 RepID=UPI0011CAAAC8|nr:hypothetical protein [Homoserinibacter sp. GY 40078]TXK16233.1 hypothetical protein FVQ89_13310 [Homoserinibacter sp. GY 40078]